LGIDLGTSSVKVVVLDLDGRMQAVASATYPVENPRPRWAETDPVLWWRAVVAAVQEAVASSRTAPVAIGLSGQMHGLVATGGDGAPLRPAMLWSDARAVDQLARYRELPDPVRARLRNPLTPGMAGPMLAWLAQHEKRTYASVRWALQPKDWVRARLTGAFLAEPSDASATLLYDIFGDTWDADVVAALGLNPELLAPLLPSSGQQAGELLPEAARELGLEAGIPVAAGAGDTAAAALGSGLLDPTHAQLTIGTGAQIVTPATRPKVPSIEDLDPATHLYRAATDTGWYSMAAILNGGLALDWARRLLGASWAELYAAAATPPEADDPLFLPHLNGERTPYLDPSMRGAWVGLGPRHDRTRLLRAALEGVALAVRDALECLRRPGTPLDDLRLAGGGSTDTAWRQLLSDVLGSTLRAVDVSAASGRGAAVLGARAAGLIDEQALLGRLATVPEPSATPRADVAAYYTGRYELFRRRVESLRRDESTEASAAAEGRV
jgi:Sugar (pentulose and hexulose) kinases